jgi:hypothetical protein
VKTNYLQNNFLSGVLDPRASARIETDAYNNGLLVGTNIVPEHLGGVRRRPGLRHVAKLPYVLARVTSGVTVTAPNGGTTANANDDDATTLVTTTNNVSTTNPYVVLHYDLGASYLIKFIDVLGARLTAGSSTQFQIQFSTDDSNWSTAATTALPLVDTTPRSYRRSPQEQMGPLSARYVRFVRVGTTDLSTAKVTVEGMNVWTETTTVSGVRDIPFEVSTDEQYMAVFTYRSVCIFQDGAFLFAAPTNYIDSDLPLIDASSNAETMVLVHDDYPPTFLLRESATNFQVLEIDFDSIPQYDFADASSPVPVSDVQVLTFGTGYTAGDTFQIELDGAKSGSITFAGDSTAAERAATAANIAREVQKLYVVPGYTGVTCARTGALQYTVTLADASADAFGVMSGISISASAGIVVTQSATGTSRSEDAWSETRGYPRTVTFFEGRLYFGGTRSLQQTLFGSEVSNILNFEVQQGLPDEPLLITLTGAQLNAINGLFGGRSLQQFTTGGEFRFVKTLGTAITPGDAPALQTQYGAKKIRPVTIDGATQFIQRTGKAVRDFRFNYEEDSYDSLGVSSLAPHLINNVVDMAAWNGSREDEIGLTFIVNGDGTVAVLNSRKEATVQAWARWTTEGLFKAVGVVFEDRYFAVQREIAGVDGLYLELADDSYYTDCAAQSDNFFVDVSDPSSGVAGTGSLDFTHLNGEEVRVKVNGFVMENAIPVSGTIAYSGIENPTICEAGLNFNPTVTPMPLNTMTPSGSNNMIKRRIVKVWVRVYSSLGLLVNGRVLPDRKFDINTFDAAAAVPISKNLNIEESTNWDDEQDKLVTFSQVDPLPMTILGIKVQMESAV